MMGGMMGNMIGVKGGRASVCAIMTGHIEGRLGLRIALRGLRSRMSLASQVPILGCHAQLLLNYEYGVAI